MVKNFIKEKITVFCVVIVMFFFTVTASFIYAYADRPTYYIPNTGEYKGQMIYIPEEGDEYDSSVLCIITPLPEQP